MRFRICPTPRSSFTPNGIALRTSSRIRSPIPLSRPCSALRTSRRSAAYRILVFLIFMSFLKTGPISTGPGRGFWNIFPKSSPGFPKGCERSWVRMPPAWAGSISMFWWTAPVSIPWISSGPIRTGPCDTPSSRFRELRKWHPSADLSNNTRSPSIPTACRLTGFPSTCSHPSSGSPTMRWAAGSSSLQGPNTWFGAGDTAGASRILRVSWSRSPLPARRCF